MTTVTNNEKTFKIFYQNLQSLENKIDPLAMVLDDIMPHVFVVVEHHLKENDLSRICIGDYVLSSNFSRVNMQKGGVAIFIKRPFLHLITNHLNWLARYCIEGV